MPSKKYDDRDRPRRIIAPRLASGLSRVGIGHGLPPEVKDGLRMLAYRENRSVSWILEQLIIRHFHLQKPEYVDRKAKPIDRPPKKPSTL